MKMTTKKENASRSTVLAYTVIDTQGRIKAECQKFRDAIHHARICAGTVWLGQTLIWGI